MVGVFEARLIECLRHASPGAQVQAGVGGEKRLDQPFCLGQSHAMCSSEYAFQPE